MRTKLRAELIEWKRKKEERRRQKKNRRNKELTERSEGRDRVRE